MSELFIKILNMSISASWIVFAIFILRLLLKKAPKWVIVLMWGIVGIRLVCPLSFESVFSLIPSETTVSPQIMLDRNPHINSGIPLINNTLNPVISSSFAPNPMTSANPLQILIPILSNVWLLGIIAMLIYSVVSFLIIKNRVKTAVKLKENLFQSESVISPFVLGIIKPKIYLPFNMNDGNIEYVTAHEKAHISRKDHLWKPIGFLLLSIYWFNPFLWIAYVFLCRDIELACDEKVVKAFDNIQRADYSQALLACSVNRRMISACPLAFGEVGVKNRIKSVLNYKRPAFWIVLVSIALSLILAACFLTNPKSNRLKTLENHSYEFIPEQAVTVLSYDGESYKALNSEPNKQLLQQLINLKISKREVSLNRGEDRDTTNTLVIQTKEDLDSTEYSYIKGTYIHFNYDFTEVWIDDGVKPTLSYKVIEPDKAINIYNKILNSSSYSFAENAESHTDYGSVYFTLESISYDIDNNVVFDVIWRNNSQKQITIGDIYSIEYKDGDKWVDTATEEIYFDLLGYPINPKDVIRKSYTSKRFDLSKNGRYRIIAPFSLYNTNDDYSAWIEFDVNNSTAGGVDSSNVVVEKIVTSDDLEQLKIKYPMYFDLDTSNGLEVYIWQMAEDSYYCGLLPGNNSEYTEDELWELYNNPTTIDEMKAIVSSYMPYIVKEIITICPTQNPFSSYWNNIDEKYTQELTTLFWSDFPVLLSQSYSSIIDSATFDIDNDGTVEYCQLRYGPTSGAFTFTFSVFENGKIEYFNIFYSPHLSLCFENVNGDTVLVGKQDNLAYNMSIDVSDGNIVLNGGGLNISYWGEQGIDSPYVSFAIN